MGFDISSSTIGWCLLELDDANCIVFVASSFYKPPKKGDIIERLSKTKKEIIKLLKTHTPDVVAVEELIKFMPGQSTSTGVIAMTGFNRIVCLTIYEQQKQLPFCYNVLAIRHGLKLDGILPKKEEIPDMVAQHLGMAPILHYDTKDRIDKTTYDQADATAVALYAAKVLSGEITPKNKTKKKKRKKAKK
jgi:Holliday junction resolvasome RuvABC endonuclease subunit